MSIKGTHAIKDDSHRDILYDCAKCRIQTEGMYFFLVSSIDGQVSGEAQWDVIPQLSGWIWCKLEEITQRELAVFRQPPIFSFSATFSYSHRMPVLQGSFICNRQYMKFQIQWTFTLGFVCVHKVGLFHHRACHILKLLCRDRTSWSHSVL